MAVKIGDKFERLLVVELIKDRKNPKSRCICDCGNEAIPQRGALVNGRAKSCGCLKIEIFKKNIRTHGASGTTLFQIWNGIKARCNNPNDKAYKNYGGRGITISDDWRDFVKFSNDIGERPNGKTLERKDTNGPYSKDNCIWASWTDQAVNKRVSKRWLINGVEFISSVEAAKNFGVNTSVINRRTNGYWRNGIWHPPVAGYSSRLVYDET